MFWYGPGFVPARAAASTGRSRSRASRRRRRSCWASTLRRVDGPPMHEAVPRTPTRRRSSSSRWSGTRAANVLDEWPDALAVPRVADRGRRLVRATRPSARRRRTPRRSHATIGTGAFPNAHGIVDAPPAYRRSADQPVERGPGVPDRADARRPVRPRDGQRAGRRHRRHGRASTSGCWATARCGAAATGHRGDAREGRRRDARRARGSSGTSRRVRGRLRAPGVRERCPGVRGRRARGGPADGQLDGLWRDNDIDAAAVGVRHAGAHAVPGTGGRGP